MLNQLNSSSLEYLNFYRENGLNLVPVTLGEGKHFEWKPYKDKKSTDTEIGAWVSQTDSFAIVAGHISDLVVIDVDGKGLFHDMNLSRLATGTYTEQRGDRYHIFLRIKRPIATESLRFEGKEDIGILAEGKLVFCGGMPHPKGGEEYKHWAWSPKTIAVARPDLVEHLKRDWREHRGLVTKIAKGHSGLPEGISIDTPLINIIKGCGETLKEVKDMGEWISCRCPLPGHRDENPSFGINKKGNYFNCYACGKAGNAIKFIMEYYTLSKKDAIKHLKDKGLLKEAEPDTEEVFRHKCFFEEDNTLYMEVFNQETKEYNYAYLEDGNVKLTESVGDIKPVELLVTQEGEPAMMVKIPTENVTTCDLLLPDALKDKIRVHIEKYCDMTDLDLDLSVFYLLFTWFYKKLGTLGYLRFIGDTGKGKSRLQRVVSDLCFYPLSAGGSGSFSGMMRQNEKWHGTLVVDEGNKFSEQALTYFLLGIEKEKYFILTNKHDPTKQELFDPYGPKIFSMRRPFKDVALESRCASISPDETRREEIPVNLPEEYDVETLKLHDEIARFVLEHWTEVDGNILDSFEVLGQERRIRQMTMPLSIVAQLWPEGKELLTKYAIGRKKELTRERSVSWDGGMFNLVHDIATGTERLPEYPSYYDKENDIVAITPTMIAKILKITTKTATQTLRGIGFELERPRITLYNEKGNSVGNKLVRCYKVPSQKKWEDIITRYHYTEEEETQTTLGEELNDGHINIPENLKSGRFIETVTHVTHVTGVYTKAKKKNNNNNIYSTIEIPEKKKISLSVESPVTCVTCVTNPKELETPTKDEGSSAEEEKPNYRPAEDETGGIPVADLFPNCDNRKKEVTT